MADVSQERGYGEEQKPELAHQDEFGHKTDNDSPAIDGSGYGGVSESEPPHHKIHTADEPLPKPSAGYGDEGLQEHGEEAYAPAEESTPQNSQFGLEGKTASNGSSAATVPDREEVSHEAAGHGAPATGSTIAEDTSPKHGAKKEGFMSKLMEKLPGHHPKSADATAFDAPTDTASPTTPPKKGLVSKLMEKLPGHHDKSTDL